MSKNRHVSDGDLIRWSDGELTPKAAAEVERHLAHCAECRALCSRLQEASNVYASYQLQCLQSQAGDVPRGWPALQIDAHATAGVGRYRLWQAVAAAVVCLVFVAWFFYPEAQPRKMSRLLQEASRRSTPHQRRLEVTTNGRRWYRAAILNESAGRDAEHVQSLFVEAHYSWTEPLSARSFATWRAQVQDRHDQVQAFSNGDERERFYRLQTDSPTGLLRTASLTLRADTFNAVQGDFRFADRENVTITDAGEMPHAVETKAAKPFIEQKVSAEDELRVFAALNAIGADVGEPITIDTDGSRTHIIVTGTGVATERALAIRDALAGIKNTEVHLGAGSISGGGIHPARPDEPFSDAQAPLRKSLEAQAGGALKLQELTDQALDASTSLLAQANALQILARRFSPATERILAHGSRETLQSLQSRHAVAINAAIEDVQTNLSRIVALPKEENSDETPGRRRPSWQVMTTPLLDRARELDRSLSRLLAGSYSEEEGKEILHRLPGEIAELRALARTQATTH